MNILIPDLPEFQRLSMTGATLIPYDPRAPQPERLAAGADGLILWASPKAAYQALLQASGLRWVLTLTAGVDHVADLTPPGVELYNASKLHDHAVATHVLAGMLAAARGLHLFRDAQRASSWQRREQLATLRGAQVVIWGFGHIGRLLGDMLSPLGAEVSGIRSSDTPEQRAALLAGADWTVLLLPSTPQTRGTVNAEQLAVLKPGSWLVNAGRGDLVDTGALVARLQSGHLGGAVLDVTDPEPLPADHPLWQLENVILTPHVGSATADVLERASAYATEFVETLLLGRAPEGLVDRERGY
ncbi:D-2-hydroxyacid dehydrogenase [Deinococcus lacus]|uniref:D-2-hydroxyacid dehydrogenase n=1 Tax=Deinococcus lacus TaxID=392561 RepID=A0ABW1YCU3_9DEIO